MPPDPSGAHQPATARVLPLPALWRTRSYLRPYLPQVVFMLACACAAVAAEITVPLLAKSIIDGPIRHGQTTALVLLALAATGLGAAHALASFLRRWVQAKAVTGMERAMRDDLYAHLQTLQPGFHDDWQSGQLLSRAITDLSAIRRFAGFGIVFLVINVITFVTVITLLITLNWRLGLLTGVALLPVTGASTWFQRRYRVLSRLAQDQQGDVATSVEEAATGIAVLKALGRGDRAIAQHGAHAALVYQTQVSKARLRGAFWAGLDLVPNAVIGLLLLLGAAATASHRLSLGGLVAFVTLTLQLVWPIEALGHILASGQEAATAAQRIYEILDTRPAITTPARPGHPGPPRSRRRASAALAFEGIEFRYPGTATRLLRGVCLNVEPGQTLALTGETGSGKTTLLQMVPRLADPDSGRLLLDGADIRDLPLPTLRSRIGCAFEDPLLFSASARENITFGAPGASDADIERALRTAQATFVYDLPWGLETRIGERGMALSGGQRQRVALARAILSRPPVLILDDPLSALDVRTEEKVTAALHEVLAGTTAVITAHRPSTVALADTVALLDGGLIAAVGTHSRLLATEPRYRALMGGEPAPAPPDEPPPSFQRGPAVAR